MGNFNFTVLFRELEKNSPANSKGENKFPEKDFLSFLQFFSEKNSSGHLTKGTAFSLKNSKFFYAKSRIAKFSTEKGPYQKEKPSVVKFLKPFNVSVKLQAKISKPIPLKVLKREKQKLKFSEEVSDSLNVFNISVSLKGQNNLPISSNVEKSGKKNLKRELTLKVLTNIEREYQNYGSEHRNLDLLIQKGSGGFTLNKFGSYLTGNHSFGEKFTRSQKKEQMQNPNIDNWNPTPYRESFNIEKFALKKVRKIPNAEYNRVKKVFSFKIPLDEHTVLKIKAVKNNFYAQINTSAEKVNLLIQNLQTITQQIANLGFSNTVIRVQASNMGGGNTKNNNSSNHNNKDKHANFSKERVEGRPNTYRASFSFYL